MDDVGRIVESRATLRSMGSYDLWVCLGFMHQLIVSPIISLSPIHHAMLNVNCREVGFDCGYVVKGETEEELMKDDRQHAVRDHGYNEENVFKPELQEKIRSHIRRT